MKKDVNIKGKIKLNKSKIAAMILAGTLSTAVLTGCNQQVMDF